MADPVKMSRSNICHDSSSPFYERVKTFTAFSSISECLEAGGRLPKTGSSQHDNEPSGSTKYDRSYFQHWSDDDGNCINTRHEMLMAQSTSTVDTGSNPCTAERGKWFDPYTGKTFYNARELDIDHVVPLYWSWQHGADQWTDQQRKAFANDEANLLAVQAKANREKGAQSPMEWLPPDSRFHCQYVTRFKRIVLKYSLQLSELEQQQLDLLRADKCSR